MKNFITALLIFATCNVHAQLKLSGKITDKQTGQALQSVSVYINNTSIGTITNANGEFTLNAGIQKGDLIASFLGYETFTQTVTGETVINIQLTAKAKELEDYVVRTYEKDGWKKWGKFFMDNFIGEGINSADCTIENIHAIKFRNDKATNTLEAVATEPLQIKNKALGYLLTYDLQSFTYNFENKILFYSGFPLFTEMKGRDGRVKKWKAKRAEAYAGSMMHFMRALYRNKITEEGFLMHYATRVFNLEKQRIKPLYAKRVFKTGPNNSITERDDDTARYYRRIMQEPDSKDFLNPIPVIADSIAYAAEPTIAALSFNNHLQVTYLKKPEPKEYAEQKGRQAANVISSLLILLNAPEVFIYSNGMYYESTSLLTEGFWSWSEKICNMLPFDYK